MTETIARPGQDLAFHLVGVHKNAAAISNDPAENEGLHDHEHHGPGGLRLHDPADLYWDPDTVEAVLEEAEEDR